MKISLLIGALILCSNSYSQDTLKTFIFGHSLINHEMQVNVTPSQETSVPHWFHFLANEAGYNYAASGQYGFLSQHANLPPASQWGFDFVTPAWDDYNQAFSEADFDNILITPGNFIQYQGPTENYYNDNQSPIDYTSQIFDWVTQQEDSLTLYVYENWPDMAPFLSQGFPPSAQEWSNYNAEIAGGFHDWFLEYHDSLILAHPQHCVRMIPTGPAISNLLQTQPFDQIAIDSLYEDDAPHGRPTIYFLAAMITYMAMYEEQPPASYQPTAFIDPIIANNYQEVSDFLWNELLSFNDGLGNSRVFCQGSTANLNDQETVSLQLYPNPATSSFTIETDSKIERVVLIDVNGKTLRTTQDQEVDIQDLNSGLYFVQIKTDSGEIIKRIVKE